MAGSGVVPDKERTGRFWRRQPSDRPLISAWVGSFSFPELFPVGLRRLPEGELQPEDVQFEYFREDYENLFAAHAAASSDIAWSAFPLVVLPWAEAVAGCHIIHREGNIWAEPWIEDYAQLPDGRVPLHEGWLRRLVAFTEWLVELSAGRFPVAVCLMRGPADLLAAVRGAERCIMDLMDTPAVVDKALASLTDLWLQTAKAQQARIPAFDGGYGWSIQNLWSPAPGGWFQDDAIAFWSPRLYKEHAYECEKRLSTWAPYTGIHLHSAAIFTVEPLLTMPALGVIEMNLDISGLTIPEMIPAFRKILRTQRLNIWGAFSDDDLRLMSAKLPARGLMLQLMAEQADEVNRQLALVEELWRPV